MARPTELLCGRLWLCVLWAVFACGWLCTNAALAKDSEPTALTSAQAARGDAQSLSPPSAGWVSVSVPDNWQSRWPDYNGVVWYRLTWDQSDASTPSALLIEDLNMAGVIAINGVVLHRDASLVEPLSRAWNTPRFFTLEPPLLRVGRNQLVLRVSGLAAYSPGVGRVWVGAQAPLRASYERMLLVHHDVPMFMVAADAALGCFFLILWLMRRREVAFGWFGLSTLCWLAYDYNFIATSPWPLTSTFAWQSLNALFLLWFGVAYTMFVLRICERRFPRVERALWIFVALATIAAVTMPPSIRDYLVFSAALLVLGVNVLLIVWAWRGDKIELRILSGVALLYVVAGVHDLLVFGDFVRSIYFFTDTTTFTNTLCIAAMLAWRYAHNMERAEHFNVTLQRDVDAARVELAANLAREHATEMAHARIGERLNLVRDIHDGFGGSLMGSIAAIERAPQQTSAPALLKLLKELRDELRLIIDTAVIEPAEAVAGLDEQLAPLRHRMTRLLDANGIVCRWQVAGIELLRPTSAQSLDVLRFVQEALTNVLKHSAATQVQVSVHANAQGLTIDVLDNGQGFAAAPGQGAGMLSMQARARRLGGQLRISSQLGEVHVALVGALPPTA